MTQEILQEDLERIAKLRLIDDDFMSKCFEDNIECTELVIQIVLGRDDLKVEQVRTQHQIKNLQGRSITLDIYAVDKDGKKYNIEIQRSDIGASPERARFHSSILDSNGLKASQGYKELVETYVIFITETDVLKGNLPIYHIDRVIKETGQDFGDGSHIIYVNGEYQDDTPLGILMQDFFCTDPDQMHYPQLAERTKYFKKEKEGVATMSSILEDMRREVAERVERETTERVTREVTERVARETTERVARETTERVARETTKNNARETASKLLRSLELSYEQVADCVNLSLSEVKELAKTLGV